MNVFRILVVAVVASLLTLLIIQMFSPYLYPTIDPKEEIRKLFDVAEFNMGQTVSSELNFNGGNSILAMIFEEKNKLVRFQCNDPHECCDKKIKCDKAIEWEERKIKIKRNTYQDTSVRCAILTGIAACTIYVGQKPGQLDIKNEEEIVFDHAKDTLLNIPITLKNTGNIDIINEITLITTIYGEDNVSKDPFFIHEQKNTYNKLKKQAEKSLEITIDQENINSNGKYIIELYAESIDGGFVLKKTKLTVKNAIIEECKVVERTPHYRKINAKCYQKLFCSGCKYAAQCANEWEKKRGKEFEITDPLYTLKEVAASNCE